jgi:hypothetical protein
VFAAVAVVKIAYMAHQAGIHNIRLFACHSCPQ